MLYNFAGEEVCMCPEPRETLRGKIGHPIGKDANHCTICGRSTQHYFKKQIEHLKKLSPTDQQVFIVQNGYQNLLKVIEGLQETSEEVQRAMGVFGLIKRK